MGGLHDKRDLRKNYLYNANLAHRFWLGWMKSYLPSLQGRNKCRTHEDNLTVNQLVLVGDTEQSSGSKNTYSYRGAYRLGRVQCLHPQTRKGKQIVRRVP